jgi:hypothetical protein
MCDLNESLINKQVADSVSAPVVQGKKPGRVPKCTCGVCPTCKHRVWVANWRKRQSK